MRKRIGHDSLWNAQNLRNSLKLKVNASFECKKGGKSLFKRIERSIVEKIKGKVEVVNSRDVSILSLPYGNIMKSLVESIVFQSGSVLYSKCRITS